MATRRNNPPNPPSATAPVTPSLTLTPIAASVRRLVLVVTLALYAFLQGFWVAATPLQAMYLPDNLPAASASAPLLVGLGPDEKEHFLYILSLANRGQLPAPSPRLRSSPDAYVSYQAQHPPVFYALVALMYKILGGVLGASGFWYFLRGVCALCGGVVVWLIHRAAWAAFPDRPFIGLAAAPFTAFLPMFAHMMGNVSNEPLAMIFTAWAWWQMARLVRSDTPPTLRDAALLGATLGVASLVRQTAVMWLPAAALVLVWSAGRGGQSVKARLVPLAVCFAAFFALLSPWLLHNQLAYHTPLFRTFYRPLLVNGATFADFWSGQAPTPPGHPVSINPRYVLLYFASTAWTPYWLVRGYVAGPPGWNAIIFWQLVATLLGAFALLRLVLYAVRPGGDRGAGVLLAAAGLTLAFCVGTLIQQILYVDWDASLSPGRYLIAAAPATTTLFLFAVSTLLRGRRSQIVGAGAVALAMLLTDIYLVAQVRHFYADNPAQPATQHADDTDTTP